tara:strand:- start:252 stop:479 length:228 start_codon:yes stop_codon:yes gene_type:complete
MTRSLESKVTIDEIDCYGEFFDDSNVLIVGDYEDGTELEDLWCGKEGIDTWDKVVKELKEWADREGITLYELSTC